MEPDVSLLCSQEPTTGPYSKPDKSSPVLPSYFFFRSILLSSSFQGLGLQSGPSLLIFWPKFFMYISPLSCATCPAHLIILDLFT